VQADIAKTRIQILLILKPTGIFITGNLKSNVLSPIIIEQGDLKQYKPPRLN